VPASLPQVERDWGLRTPGGDTLDPNLPLLSFHLPTKLKRPRPLVSYFIIAIDFNLTLYLCHIARSSTPAPAPDVAADFGFPRRDNDVGLDLFLTSALGEIKREVATVNAQNSEMQQTIRTMSAGFNTLDATLAAAREQIVNDNSIIMQMTARSNDLLIENTFLLMQLKILVAEMAGISTDELETPADEVNSRVGAAS
jgi:hypothetical protein